MIKKVRIAGIVGVIVTIFGLFVIPVIKHSLFLRTNFTLYHSAPTLFNMTLIICAIIVMVSRLMNNIKYLWIPSAIILFIVIYGITKLSNDKYIYSTLSNDEQQLLLMSMVSGPEPFRYYWLGIAAAIIGPVLILIAVCKYSVMSTQSNSSILSHVNNNDL